MSYTNICDPKFVRHEIHAIFWNRAIKPSDVIHFWFKGKRLKERRRPITPLLQELHFLPVRQRISYKITLLSFKCLKGYAPNYLSDMIHVQSPNKSYSLRSNTDEHLLEEGPTYNYRRTSGAFSIAAPKIWNKLPHKIRSVQKLSTFKSALKIFF